MESKYACLKTLHGSISTRGRKLESSASVKRIWKSFFEKGLESAVERLSEHENRKKLNREMDELERRYLSEAPEIFAKTIKWSLGSTAAGWALALICSCTDATQFVPKGAFDIAVLGSAAFGMWSLRMKDAALAVSEFADGAREFSSSVWKKQAMRHSE